MKNLYFILITVILSSCSTKEFQFFGMEIEDKVTHSYADVFELAQNGPVENVILDGFIHKLVPKKVVGWMLKWLKVIP